MPCFLLWPSIFITVWGKCHLRLDLSFHPSWIQVAFQTYYEYVLFPARFRWCQLKLRTTNRLTPDLQYTKPQSNIPLRALHLGILRGRLRFEDNQVEINSPSLKDFWAWGGIGRIYGQKCHHLNFEFVCVNSTSDLQDRI